VDLVDVSTPLTIQHYLRKEQGGAVGLDQTPARYCHPTVQRVTDPRTPVPGLWLTGQDTLLCGVPLVQLSGLITALRVLGLAQGARFVLQNVLWDVV
jgi:all-trans-retinol 13,14-reductase